MITDGYGAVTTRRVSKEAGLASALVHYYFSTTDDLLIALYRRTVEETHKRLADALVGDHPIRDLWAANTDASRTALAVEFMALANHRKAIQAELVRGAEQARRLQAIILSPAISRRLGTDLYPDVGVAAILSGIARMLVTEQGIGLSLGHPEARAILERLLKWLETTDASAPIKSRKAKDSKPVRKRAGSRKTKSIKQ
jgi:AcrR family transcriptional regulator